jgi:protein SCO1/2
MRRNSQHVRTSLSRSIASLVACAVLLASATHARAADLAGATAPDFTLSDQHGKSFTLSKERGRPVVLFFGYAHCPDVCPTILANLVRAKAALGSEGSHVTIVLVTVDPKRDTAAALGEFVSAFDPSILALTGSEGRLADVYRAYHVRIIKQPGGPNDYLVSHTAFVYYIDRGGRLRGFGTWNDSQAILHDDLSEIASSR